MAAFKLNLYTPKGVVIKDLECDDLVIPTVRGQINILPEHTHILTELSTGMMTVKTTMGTRHFTVTAGLCRVLKDTVTILAFTSEKAEDIDIARAKAAKAKAMDRLSGKEAISDVDLIKFRRKLERAELRLRAANLK
ncbi:MAG TPA: ATP synthase F1 subunit epsilon [Bacteriovoracaceae bacterium]|nr:ATP synthase F1 subunit epsilon [Bacteriovoracaceae bacterium]HLW56667.1 ATP synthase F1 subunit epsilon [Bacteriovoracaceae bacterium]